MEFMIYRDIRIGFKSLFYDELVFLQLLSSEQYNFFLILFMGLHLQF